MNYKDFGESMLKDYSLFFELIRISMGLQHKFSINPSTTEWDVLFSMSKEHAITGVCFAGVREVYMSDQKPPKDIYLMWLAHASKIQQRNELMNKYSVAAEGKLNESGFKTCILKGQGVAQLYGEGLTSLRESGDIDMWVDGGIKSAYQWLSKKYGKVDFDYINAHLPMFKDVEVELHWRVSSLYNLIKNKKLQNWFEQHKGELLNTFVDLPDNIGRINVPSIRFNRFYILLHCYNHMFSEGLGLRQIMDYYYVLKKEKMTGDDKSELQNLLKSFGLYRFTQAMMWIMEYVFRLDREYMVCAPNEKEGRFILEEVMQNGNMGHHDVRIKRYSNNIKLNTVLSGLQHSSHLIRNYPMEFLWKPIWIISHFLWKRIIFKLR